MSISNEVALRPRFKFKINHNNEHILKLFDVKKNEQSEFIVTRVDDHVFIKIPKAKQHFWSPQLHLEIAKNEIEDNSIIYGLFGPNPTIWTMFMFFHFIVAGLFIGFSVWAYTNWSLGEDYAIQLFITLFTILVWFALYFGCRIGKNTGMDQMHELHHFMRDTLRDQDIHSVE